MTRASLQIFGSKLSEGSKRIEFRHKKKVYLGKLAVQDDGTVVIEYTKDASSINTFQTFKSFSGWAKSITNKANSGWDNCYMDGKKMADWRSELGHQPQSNKKRPRSVQPRSETQPNKKQKVARRVQFHTDVAVTVYQRDDSPTELDKTKIIVKPLKVDTSEKSKRLKEDAVDGAHDATEKTQKEDDRTTADIIVNGEEGSTVVAADDRDDEEGSTVVAEGSTVAADDLDDDEEEDKPSWLTEAQFNRILFFIHTHGDKWNHFDMSTGAMKSIVVQLAVHMQFLRKDTSFARKCSMYVSGICMVRCRMKFTENQEVKAIFRNNTTIDNDVVVQL